MKGRPANFQAKKYVVLDDVRLASVENHMAKRVSNCKRCRKCRRKGPQKRTRYMCDKSIRNFITNLLSRPFREI
ncbi:hypothetical protein TNCV_3469551 [Trichonephila clavipes]|nr:hypothetical protein TNCV_3469551 [Trichonephila clavipes]